MRSSFGQATTTARPRLIVTYAGGGGDTPTPTPTVNPNLTATSTPTVAATQVLVLSQGDGGYAGNTDTWVNSFDPTLNYNHSDRVQVRSSSQANTLIRFDLAPVPPNVTIKRALLQLTTLTRSNPSSVTVAAYRLRRIRDDRPGQLAEVGLLHREVCEFDHVSLRQ